MIKPVEFVPSNLIPSISDREPSDTSMFQEVLEYVVAPYVVDMYNRNHQIGDVKDGTPLSEVDGDLYILARGNCCYVGESISYDMPSYPMVTNCYIHDTEDFLYESSDVATMGVSHVEFELTRDEVIQVLRMFLEDLAHNQSHHNISPERMKEIYYVLECLTL